jgi:nitrite reductase/ring-hydroxylating ferredoxin subunit
MEIHVGSVTSFADPGHKVVACGSVEVGVFRLEGKFTAFENVCPHLQGPVCQGKLVPLTLEDMDVKTKQSEGRVFSKDHLNIVCPWHGYEFDIRTGRHCTNSRIRLRSISVSVRDGEVFIEIPENRLSEIIPRNLHDGVTTRAADSAPQR